MSCVYQCLVENVYKWMHSSEKKQINWELEVTGIFKLLLLLCIETERSGHLGHIVFGFFCASCPVLFRI